MRLNSRHVDRFIRSGMPSLDHRTPTHALAPPCPPPPPHTQKPATLEEAIKHLVAVRLEEEKVVLAKEYKVGLLWGQGEGGSLNSRGSSPAYTNVV